MVPWLLCLSEVFDRACLIVHIGLAHAVPEVLVFDGASAEYRASSNQVLPQPRDDQLQQLLLGPCQRLIIRIQVVINISELL